MKFFYNKNFLKKPDKNFKTLKIEIKQVNI